MKKRIWAVDLADSAERDFDGIVFWTAEKFGPRQAEAYAKLIEASLDRLTHSPSASPSRSRDEVGSGFRTLHFARPGRHFLLYKVDDERVQVMRILHDSMEIGRHVPTEE